MDATNSFSNTISLLALVIACGALAWNIVRDFVLDRVKINFSAAVGEARLIAGSTTAMFADSGTFDQPIKNPKLLLTIVNVGRRHIFLHRIQGKYKTGKKRFVISIAGLPRKLEPYEVFSSITPLDKAFLDELNKDNIAYIWVEDTAGGKWYLSHKEFDRLKKTANTYYRQQTTPPSSASAS